MGDLIIIGILAVVVLLGVLHMGKHFRGGGCCGSGSNTIRIKKTLTEPTLGRFTMTVEGMRCENCQARVENALNRLDGVVCLVNLRRKTAEVSYSRPFSQEEARSIVEKLGYSVTKIQ